MIILLMSLFFLVAISLIVLVLVQPSASTDMAFSGTSLLRNVGDGGFITKLTAIVTALFFVLSILIARYYHLTYNQRQWTNLQNTIDAKQNKVPTTKKDK